MTTTTTKKITLASVKSFVRKNNGNLFINVRSSFDGMTDCCESRNEGFGKAVIDTDHPSHTLGIKGAWFVGDSRDYLYQYDDGKFSGIRISNSCGDFILATQKSI